MQNGMFSVWAHIPLPQIDYRIYALSTLTSLYVWGKRFGYSANALLNFWVGDKSVQVNKLDLLKRQLLTRFWRAMKSQKLGPN